MKTLIVLQVQLFCIWSFYVLDFNVIYYFIQHFAFVCFLSAFLCD